MSATGALAGALAGLGAWLVVLGLPWHRRPTLDQRLAPYLRGARVRGEPYVHNGSALREWAQPVLDTASVWAARVSGGNASVERRLRRLGSGLAVEQFRAQQVIAGFALSMDKRVFVESKNRFGTISGRNIKRMIVRC